MTRQQTQSSRRYVFKEHLSWEIPEKQWGNTSYLKAIIVVGQLPIFHQYSLKNKLFLLQVSFCSYCKNFKRFKDNTNKDLIPKLCINSDS